MKTYSILIVIIIAAVMLPLGTYAQVKEPVRVGVILPYTGPLASLGDHVTKGMELYFNEINWKAGGREITLLKEDDEGKPQIGLDKARKLVESKKAHMLVGPISSAVAYAVAEYAVAKRVPFIINNAGAIELTQKKASKYIFRTSFANGQYEYPLAPYAYKKLGYRKVILMASDWAAGYEKSKAFKKEFLKEGGQVTQEIYTPLGAADFGPYLSKVKDADAVWTFYTGSDAIKFVKQFAEYGLKKKMGLMGVGSLTNEVYVNTEGDAALDIVTSSFYNPHDKNPLNARFVKAFVEKFKALPSYDDYAGYISSQVIAKALDKIQGDVEKTDQFLEALKGIEFDGPTGRFRFDEKQNVILTVYIQKVVKQEGKLTNALIETIPNVKQISID
jgi:branched-chain amino acid transport system substrate-binding protein